MGLVVISPDSCVLQRSVHPFNLTVGPWVVGLGETMLDVMLPAGSVEGMAAPTLALQRKVREGVREGRTTALGEKASFEEILVAYHAKDPLAVSEVEHLAENLARSLVSCINFINPDLIVLGEAALDFGDHFLHIVKVKLKEMVLPSVFERISVQIFGVEGDIAMIGSSLSVLQETFLSKGGDV
jgi:predicted NBD/HSP70 family sugar kinase